MNHQTNKGIMKNLIIVLIATFTIISTTSCRKEVVEPKYEYVLDTDSTANVYATDGYTDGGTLPNVVSDQSILIGTQWVLTKYVSSFATEYPNDTINFVDNQYYTLNGGAVRKYTLAKSPTNSTYDLTLYYFFPFGGSHYSAEVSEFVVDDGEINNTEFEDIRQGENTTIKAWLIKL